MGQIFLSHVEEDSRAVKAMADALESAGYTTWYYERDSLPGIPHPIQTGEAIEESQAIVLFVSAQLLDRPRHVKREVYQAIECDKAFIPLLLDVSYAEFKQRGRELEHALAGAVAISLPATGPSSILPSVVAGLKKLGIQPGGPERAGDKREEEALEALAEAAHVLYCAGKLEEGYRWRERDVAYLERHSLLKPFAASAYDGTETLLPFLVSWENLSGEDKEQNRGQVRDIPSRLEALGYAMRKARGGVDPTAFVLSRHMLELLAEQEHERWLWAKLRAGWRYGAIRNNRRKLHPAMLPWRVLSSEERDQRYGVYADRIGPDELAEGDKQKDREAVREMAQIVAAAGYEIIEVRERGVIVGVTGHHILAELEKIEWGIGEALNRIERSFPGEPLTVMSALAEGADRLVVKQLLARSTGGLVAVLPLAAADYETDFESDESKQEFRDLLAPADEVIELPPATTREAVYEAVGEYIVDHCDVLVTVWDGQGAQGQGGTGGVVARARERALPVAWVRAGNRKPGTSEPTSLGDEQGMVTFERLEPA